MFLADLHIHSRYSRATSRDCVPEHLEAWARRKGLDVIGTGDFTHPAWRDELREKLEPAEDGLYTLKDPLRLPCETDGTVARPRFIVTGEISSIYKKNGRVRKVHNLLLLPGLEQAERLAKRLEEVGNLHSDGRPILGLDSRDLLEITLETCPGAVFIPAHIWTPHFSLFGAYSGFDDIRECFEDLTPHIHALETGLSSDPPMNWRLSALDGYTLVSNSDAHSPAKLGREANLFGTELSFPAMARALETPGDLGFQGTVEFFPEEGKYHFDGHRSCGQCLKPEQTEQLGGRCPVCGGRITVGVLHRVEELADREEGYLPEARRHYESLVPLPEVIAASTGRPATGKKVQEAYIDLLRKLGPEFSILREIPLDLVERAADPCVAEGIRRLRAGKVELRPGYDGEYGQVRLLDPEEIERYAGQLFLFEGGVRPAGRETEKKPGKVSRKKAGTPAAVALEDAPHYGLNDEQWTAASAKEGAVAVIAGPGTGKTRTLVCRIAYLVEERGVDPAHITAVTFTNKAAREMKERLLAHFGDKRTVRAMTIGTFHAICLNRLSERKEPAAVLDQEEAVAIALEILDELGLKLSVREALQAVSARKSGLDGWENEGKAGPYSLFYDAYTQRLQNLSVLDFDDLLLRELQAQEGGTAPSGFTHLLVDEFQDINPVQFRLIRAWSRGGESLFVIGDPDQAIYGFRGSDARCFDRLREERPALREITLFRNYRSAPPIIGAALPVLSRLPGEAPPRLEAQRGEGERVRLLTASDPFDEALFIAKEINRLVGGMDMLEAGMGGSRRPVRPMDAVGFSDIAVLYRTHRQAELIEQCLRKESIPYVVAGREDFLAEEPVRGVLAFFRFLIRPEDSVSLRTLLRAAGVPRTAEGLEARAGGKKRAADLAQRLESSGGEGAAALAARLRAYAPRIRREKPDILLDGYIREVFVQGTAPAARAALDRLLDMAVLYPDMESFLQDLAFGQETDVRRSGSRAYHADAVSLMTLHGSKGLEFPVVFLCGARQGLIPLTMPGRPCDEAEERRLLYVGMTRAKEELLLLTGEEPSPFLRDLPGAFLRRESTAAFRPAYAGKQMSLFD